MNTPNATAALLSDEQKTEHIKAVVLKAGADLRARYPVLQHQDAIGAAIMAFSLLAMIATRWVARSVTAAT